MIYLSTPLFSFVCYFSSLPLVSPGVLVPVLLHPAGDPLSHHRHLIRLQALHDAEVVEDSPTIRAHPLLYLPLRVRTVPAVHNVVEVVHDVARGGPHVNQTTTNS